MIIESQHHKPGKGGAIVRTKLRNVKLGTVIDRTFRAGEVVESAFIEEKKYQYLYVSDGQYHLMDNETYEQISLSEDKIGEAKKFLKENIEVTVSMHEGEILSLRLPTFMDLKVIEAEPGVRGDTAKGGSKIAKLETGASVQVPLFISRGEVDCVITGADRIAANGDTANKIGTYTLAVLAKENGVPFYIAAPTTTIDPAISSGDKIPIEERSEEEVTSIQGVPIAPEGVNASNPAFDVTPHKYITAIITEKGIIKEPYDKGIKGIIGV